MLTAKLDPMWYESVHYGSPAPRVIKPLVRINGMVEDMPTGYIIDACLLPPTILQLDECDLTLRVNDALLNLQALLPCFKVAAASGVPQNPPSAGYLPLYVDQLTSKLWVFAGGIWILIS